MDRIRRKTGATISVLLLVSVGVLALLLIACNSGEDKTYLPSSSLPDKVNPKFDSQLNQLVIAENRGAPSAILTLS